jgi:FAD:protein FMN transferase
MIDKIESSAKEGVEAFQRGMRAILSMKHQFERLWKRGEWPDRFWLSMSGWCVLLVGVIGAGSCQTFQPRMFSQSRFFLDTIIDVTVVSRSERAAAAAMQAAYAEIERLEALFSKYPSDSAIARINQQAGVAQAVHVGAEAAALIQRSLLYAEQTAGMFHPALGAVIDLWGLGGDHERVPEPDELSQALQRIDLRQVVVAAETAQLTQAGMALDLGGIAKGYAVDRAVAVMQDHGIRQALVNAGGDIRGLGTRPDGKPWRIGIQHPRETGLLGVVEIRDAAIVTSGDYERGFIHDGVRYHHLFDPRTGYPARDCQSVTILAPSTEAADAYATAVFVLGPERGLALIEAHDELEGLIVGADGRIVTSSGLTYRPAQ